MPSRAYAILTAIGADPEAVVASMMALRRSHVPTIYLHGENDPRPMGPEMRAIAADCPTTGCMLERAREVEADLYLWIPPGVTVPPKGLETFVRAFEENPEAALFVSDYITEEEHIRIHPLRDDLTEREDFGVVWGFPASALEKVGGARPDLKHATFYDLRLKLAEIGELVHIPEPTHTVPAAPESPEEADLGAALFYPGRGAFGGFSYLFMDPEEEKEVEEVFYACLRRRGAWLELPENEVPAAEVKSGDPLATVVIPVHNRARFLPMAIESVLRGSFQDFEIIIVDNASTDDTRDVARRYAESDPRIRLLENDVNVIARALNMGVKAARGRYIAQLDSDDEYTANTLEDMVGHLESHPRCGLAISYYELMDEKGTTLEDLGIIKHLEYNLNNVLRVDGAGAVRVWHKSVIVAFGGFNETDYPNYGEDYDLVLKVSERFHVDRVHEVCYRYRRHPGNTDALRLPVDKIKAKTHARREALKRRRAINGHGE